MEMRSPTELMGLYFRHTTILAKTSVGLNIELSYEYKWGGGGGGGLLA